MNTHTKAVSKIDTILETIRDDARKQAAVQNLAWAIENADLAISQVGRNRLSVDLVQNILFSFRINCGMYLDHESNCQSNESIMEQRKNLTLAIHYLTGQEPRIVYDEEEERYIIWQK